jgi:hypothetical protein
LVTLAAVAALGGGLYSLNVVHGGDAAQSPPPAAPVTIAATSPVLTPAPVAPSPAVPPPAEFPASGAFAGRIPTGSGVITVDIKVTGEKASAYACDGASFEAWLSGTARHGALSLASKDGASRLVGRLQGGAVVGTLWVGGQQREFSAATVQSAAEDTGSRNGDA